MYFDEEDAPEIVGGVYGLGSKDTTPGQIVAVYNNLKEETPKSVYNWYRRRFKRHFSRTS